MRRRIIISGAWRMAEITEHVRCQFCRLLRESIKLSYDNIFFASAWSDLVSARIPPLSRSHPRGGASTREGFALANYPLIKPHVLLMKIYLPRRDFSRRHLAALSQSVVAGINFD